jgi:hypothetical protein
LVLMVTQFFHATFENCNKPYFCQHCHFWHRFAPSTVSSGPKLSCGPQVFYIKLFALSRRTSMTDQKNSHPQTFG